MQTMTTIFQTQGKTFMNPLSTVTVYITSLNRPKMLREAILSVLKQSIAPAKIVILDNGSESMVRESVSDFFSQGVEWRDQKGVRSFTSSFNCAIQETTTPFLFIMHDDDRLFPDFLEMQCQFLSKQPQAAAVACDGVMINEFGVQLNRLDRLQSQKKDLVLKDSAEAAFFYTWNYLPFPSFVYRTQFAKLIKMKESPDKTCGACDIVYLVELAEKGALLYHENVLFEYRIHQNQASTFFSEEIIHSLEDFLLDKTRSSGFYQKCLRMIQAKRKRRKLKKQLTSLRKSPSFLALKKVMQTVPVSFTEWADLFWAPERRQKAFEK